MTTHYPEVEKLAERSIRKWVQAEHVQDRSSTAATPDTIGPFVTIARESGSGGSEIARLAGQTLSWDVLDREIVDYLAFQYGTPRSLVEIADERDIGWVEELLTGWMGGEQWPWRWRLEEQSATVDRQSSDGFIRAAAFTTRCQWR